MRRQSCVTGAAGTGAPVPDNSLANCMRIIAMECFRRVASEYEGLSPEAVLEKLVNTDLRETCRYVDILQA